jgi:hypothetical protein
VAIKLAQNHNKIDKTEGVAAGRPPIFLKNRGPPAGLAYRIWWSSADGKYFLKKIFWPPLSSHAKSGKIFLKFGSGCQPPTNIFNKSRPARWIGIPNLVAIGPREVFFVKFYKFLLLASIECV